MLRASEKNLEKKMKKKTKDRAKGKGRKYLNFSHTDKKDFQDLFQSIM